ARSPGFPIHPPRRHLALERRLEGWDQLLKLVQRQAREIQELYRTGLQLGEPYTCHGSCLLLLYCEVRGGASYQKESGINSTAGGRETLSIELDRDRVGAMIPHHFGGDFRATPFSGSKGIDVGFGFLTGDSGPVTFHRREELFEFCTGHMHVP